MRVIDGLKAGTFRDLFSPEEAARFQSTPSTQARRYRLKPGKPIHGLGKCRLMTEWYGLPSTDETEAWHTECESITGLGGYQTQWTLRIAGQVVRMQPLYDYSLMADYVFRGTAQAITLEKLVALEKKHIRDYRRARRHAWNRYSAARARALSRFESSQGSVLDDLSWRITKINVKRNRASNELRRLVTAHLKRNLGRLPTSAEVEDVSDRISLAGSDRWSFLKRTVESLTGKIKALQARILQVLAWKFSYPSFHFGGYKPKWWDLRTGQTSVPTSLPYWRRASVLNPTVHIHCKATPSDVSLSLEYARSRKDTGVLDKVRNVKLSILYARFDYPVPTWVRNPDARGGYIVYDQDAVASAIKSMIPQPKPSGASSIPMFLVDLWSTLNMANQLLRLVHDTFTLGGSILKNLRRATSIRRYGQGARFLLGRSGSVSRQALDDFVTAAKIYSAADLYRKFGLDPLCGFLLDSTKVLLEHCAGGGKELLRFLAQRGREMVGRRIVLDVRDQVRRSWLDMGEETFQLTPYHFAGNCLMAEATGDLTGAEHHDRIHLFGEEVCTDETVSQRSSACWRDAISAVRQLALRNPSLTFDPQIEVITHRQQRLTAVYSFDQTDALGWALDDDEIRRRWCADMLGLNWSLSTLWDAIPYSFVVNFIVNVDELVKTFDVRNIVPENTLYRLCLSEREHVTCRVLPGREVAATIEGQDYMHSVRAVCRCDHAVTLNAVRYRRELIDQPPDVIPGLKVRELAWFKVLTASELVLSRL